MLTTTDVGKITQGQQVPDHRVLARSFLGGGGVYAVKGNKQRVRVRSIFLRWGGSADWDCGGEHKPQLFYVSLHGKEHTAGGPSSMRNRAKVLHTYKGPSELRHGTALNKNLRRPVQDKGGQTCAAEHRRTGRVMQVVQVSGSTAPCLPHATHPPPPPRLHRAYTGQPAPALPHSAYPCACLPTSPATPRSPSPPSPSPAHPTPFPYVEGRRGGGVTSLAQGLCMRQCVLKPGSTGSGHSVWELQL